MTPDGQKRVKNSSSVTTFLCLFWGYFAALSLGSKFFLIWQVGFREVDFASVFADSVVITICLLPFRHYSTYAMATILSVFCVSNLVSIFYGQNCDCFGPAIETPTPVLLLIELLSLFVLCVVRVPADIKRVRFVFPLVSVLIFVSAFSYALVRHQDRDIPVLTDNSQIHSFPIRGLDEFAKENSQVVFYSNKCSRCKSVIADLLMADSANQSSYIFVDVNRNSTALFFHGSRVTWTKTDRIILGVGELPARFVIKNKRLIRM